MLRFLIPLAIVLGPTVALLVAAGGVFVGLMLADAVAYGRWP
jgi:hypothetical protein